MPSGPYSTNQILHACDAINVKVQVKFHYGEIHRNTPKIVLDTQALRTTH